MWRFQNTPPNGAGRHRRRHLLTLLCVTALAACDSTTAPESSDRLNAAEALRDYQMLDSMFMSDGWAGFSALAGRTPLSGAANVAAVAALSDVRGGASSRQFTQRLLHSMTAASTMSPAPSQAGTSRVPILSDTIRGRTFTYEAAAGQYRVNNTRSGAPGNGVRFVLYEVDANGTPLADREIGYADFTDEGTSSSDDIVLRLVAVERGVTILSYRTRAVLREGDARITIDGTVADGSNRLSFDIEATGSDVNGETEVAVTFDLALTPRDFEVSGSVRGIEDGAEDAGTVDLTVRHRQQTLQVDMVGDGGTLNGEITLNGRTFVTVSGNAQQPTLVNAAGAPLSGPELLVVLNIIDTIDDVFDLVEELVEPVDNLIVLAWVL